MDFRKRTIVVQGANVEVDVGESLTITDLSQDMERVAAEMAYWGSVWAAAEREKVECDATYRHWRAMKAEQIMGADAKAAEWKVSKACEADPQFVKLKQAIAQAEENVILTKVMFDAFAKKANVLQSRGAMARDELGATGMNTPEQPKQPKIVRVRKVSNGSTGDDENNSIVRASTHLRTLNRGRKPAEV